MAYPTAVNSQVTDSVTQANTEVVAISPAMAMGNLMIATSQALSMAAHNATSAQQNASQTAQATTVTGVSTLYAIDTASSGTATKRIFA